MPCGMCFVQSYIEAAKRERLFENDDIADVRAKSPLFESLCGSVDRMNFVFVMKMNM